jgi:hypothetical protein
MDGCRRLDSFDGWFLSIDDMIMSYSANATADFDFEHRTYTKAKMLASMS